MKKNFIFLILVISFFSGCFSLSSLNPFSDSKDEEENEIIIPDNAPLWLKKEEYNKTFFAIGVSTKIKPSNLKFYKQKALINAGNNLSRKIYIKTINIFKKYLEKTSNDKIFENDIKKHAKEVSLKILNITKIKGFWQSPQNELFTLIEVPTVEIAEEIQLESKKLFKVNYTLYENILSNRAKEILIQELKEE